jgi:hypothetical protein
MSYFVLCQSEDGDVSFEKLSREELETRLAEEYWGSQPIFDQPPTGYIADSPLGILIISGEIVVPEPKEVVTEWRLPR